MSPIITQPEQGQLSAREVAKADLSAVLSRCLHYTVSIEALHAFLGQLGIELLATLEQGKWLPGAFTYQGHYFPGNEVGSAYGPPHLTATIEAGRAQALRTHEEIYKVCEQYAIAKAAQGDAKQLLEPGNNG